MGMQARRPFAWPAGFARVPDEPWASAPVDGFARAYDALKVDGWYANLDPTVAAVADWMEDGAIVVDYSGGTGILQERLLAAHPDVQAGILNVDASPKFLRFAVGKLGDDPRCAFRLLPYLKEEGRLLRLEQAAAPLVGRVDGLVCANAVHLYPDPAATAGSWQRILGPGGRLHVQSGNLGHEAGDAWIIDRTVDAIDAEARRIVLADPRYERHRAAVADGVRMARYRVVRDRYFVPVRPAQETVAAIAGAGFTVEGVRHRPVPVDTAEWAGFLAVYHEGVLPWVGGCREVDGRPADDAAVADRHALIADGLRAAVGGPRFKASWTYVDAAKPSG